MAAIRVTNIQRYIGTAAEKAALATGSLMAGALFTETDTSKLYIWDGTTWQAK